MITDEDLKNLRSEVKKRMSDKRFTHTLGVEECAVELGEIVLPEEELPALRAAALLHDITKELTEEEQLDILDRMDVRMTDAEKKATALFHAKTAPFVIRRDFPEFATEEVLKAVEYHTVGAPDMTTFEKIIFLSDHIEPNRVYSSCVSVRDYVYSALSEGGEDPLRVLDGAVFRELNFTMTALLRKDVYLSEETLRARNAILNQMNRG